MSAPLDLAALSALCAALCAAHEAVKAETPWPASSHDEAACAECQRARDRKWPPSLTCDLGYRSRMEAREGYTRERSRRDRDLQYAAQAVAPELPAALAEIAALRKVRDAAREYISAAKTWAGSADDDPGDVALATAALDAALKEAP